MTRLSARLLALDARGRQSSSSPPWPRPSRPRPKATAPKVGTTVPNMPALTWNAAKGAAQYEVQIASDSGFNPALVDVTTQNLRFVNAKMLPNGAYFWRVRSIDAANESSKWSGVRKFTKKWNAVAALLTPASLNTISYPNPAILTLGAGAGRRRRIACPSRPAQPAVAWTRPAASSRRARWRGTTAAIRSRRRTRTSPSRRRCIRARTTGRSCRSTPRATPVRRPQIFSFVWLWPGTTTPTVTDMVPGRGDLRPALPVGPIPGAASYEMEINTTSGFATGSKLFCANDLGDVVRPDRDAAEQHVLLARPRPRLAGPGRPLEQRPDVRQDL